MRAANHYFETHEDCCAYEDELEVGVRWVPGSQEYKEVSRLFTERKYQCLLDELECLVVQYLFELIKAGMSGTGMQLCFSVCWRVSGLLTLCYRV